MAVLCTCACKCVVTVQQELILLRAYDMSVPAPQSAFMQLNKRPIVHSLINFPWKYHFFLTTITLVLMKLFWKLCKLPFTNWQLLGAQNWSCTPAKSCPLDAGLKSESAFIGSHINMPKKITAEINMLVTHNKKPFGLCCHFSPL